ncbi:MULTISPECIES: M48 family metalloprotease [Bradyrhizobium]|uniref:M48 family metalloprotease n=1 Tax=Bradyrhizobium TaxID=374 RepID=UPI001BA7254D|nr:M48 family metalloprotease [Bradyrhizobium liaoningense]GMO12207.1 hypothetical protein TM233_07850 [Bradyrhizobium sp. TM233]
MQMLTRRCCIAGCGLLLFGGIGARAADTRHNPSYGCSLTASEASNILGDKQDGGNVREMPSIPKSGDKDFDRALAETLVRISDCLNVTPSFAYFDDHDSPNAFALREKRVAGTDGTVLFGQRLLKQLMADPEAGDAAVAGICAHEFGHVLQWKVGVDEILLDGQPTVKRVELHADFLAGYFAGVRKLQQSSFNAAVIALTQFNAGDNMLKHPKHHGTPKERGDAIVKGYQTGHDDRKSLLDALNIGEKYVKANF